MVGIMADPLKAAEALTIAGVHAVGNANNVNYGAPAIRSSLVRLDELGILHSPRRHFVDTSADASRPCSVIVNPAISACRLLYCRGSL